MSSKFPTATIPIYDGDDQQRMAELRAAAQHATRVAEAQKSGARRLGDPVADPTEAQAKFDAFVDEAAERAEPLSIQAIGRRRFRDLRMEHPPRKVKRVVDEEEREVTHDDDLFYKLNTETFPMALLTYIDPDDPTIRTVTSPEMPTRKALEKYFDDDLTEGIFEEAWTTAYFLNTATAADPKAVKFSANTQMSDETSG